MKIKILSSALKALHIGRTFYDKQGEGVGDYFFDSLFADIGALGLLWYAAHPDDGEYLYFELSS